MKSKNRVVVALGAVVILATIGTSSIYAAAVSPSQTGQSIHLQKDGWEVNINKDSSEKTVTAVVKYDISNAQAAQKMIMTQQALADELVAKGAPSLDVTVVFRHPLSQKAFERFVTKYGVTNVQDYTIRYVDNTGERVTINGAPFNGVLVPSDQLRFAVSDLTERAPGKITGWVQVRANIPSSVLSLISKDGHVYLIDVSNSAVSESIRSGGDVGDYSIEVISPQLYWQLEDVHQVTQETVE